MSAPVASASEPPPFAVTPESLELLLAPELSPAAAGALTSSHFAPQFR
jgi:hypothetical protein